MFAINFNFPYRKKDGSLITMEKALDGAGADLDLIDLDDVAITDPAEGDGLIYDNTAHKWKNIPIISRILTLFNAWKNNGAYNILPNNGTTSTVQGLVFTKNSDDTVTVGIGTAEEDAYFALDTVGTLSAILEAGKKYKLVGCPSGGGTDYYLYNGTSSDGVKDIGAGCEFTWSDSYNTGMFIYIKSGTVISSPLTFKPMITTDLNATYDDYVPHAMTNRKLTEKTSKLQQDIPIVPFITPALTTSTNDANNLPCGFIRLNDTNANMPTHNNVWYDVMTVRQSNDSGSANWGYGFQLAVQTTSDSNFGDTYIRALNGGATPSWSAWKKLN